MDSSPEFSVQRVLNKLQAKVEGISKHVAVENIHPDDPALKIFPQLVPEHKARYNFVGESLKGKSAEPLTILDAASGQGYGSVMLKELFPNSKVLGVELGFKYIQKAKEKITKKGVPADFTPFFVNGNVLQLPVADGSVDVVSAFEIAEHLDKSDQPSFIREIARVLKEGGTAFISTPLPYSEGIGSNPHHLYEPSDMEVRKMVEDSGLVVSDEKGQIFVKPQAVERMKKLNQVIPVWPFFAWMRRGKEAAIVRDIPADNLALTHMFVVTKPRSTQQSV